MRWMVLTVLLLICGHGSAQDMQDPFGGAAAGDPSGGQPAGDPFGGQPASDPFGGPPASAPFGGQPASGDPFGGQPAGGPGAAAAAPAAAPAAAAAPGTGKPIAADESDPAVLAIRDLNPTTASQLMFAVRALFDLGRTEEAKHYLMKLLATNPDHATLVQFYQQYGEALFLRLGKAPELNPEGEQFSRAVREAAREAAREPGRLRELVKQLASDSSLRRFRAIEELRRVDYAALAPLLEALADPSRAAEHPRIRAAIPELGEQMLDPMLGAVEAPDESLRVQVLQILGEFRSRRALTHLVGPSVDPQVAEPVRHAARQAVAEIVGQVPDQSQVERFLAARAREYYDGMLPARPDYEDRITLWTWDESQKTSVPQRLEARDASLQYAARLARDLYRLDRDNQDYRRLYLLTNLEWAKHEAGLDRPLPLEPDTPGAEAAELGMAPLEDVLSYAMQTGRPVAATAAAEVLGARGDESLLQSSAGQPRPLAMALRHGNRRLRLAAAEAILRIDPRSPFAGSSYLPEVLGWAIGTLGSRQALVVYPRTDKAQNLVGLLSNQGIEANWATTGQEAFRLAIKNPDYEFALISDAVSQPSARETVQMFRKDPRTSRLVVGLMGRLESLKAAQQFAESDPLVLAFPMPLDATGMAYQTSRLLDLAGREIVGYDERLDRAAEALEHLKRLAGQPEVYSFYDLHRLVPALRDALSSPELAPQAAEVLGMLGAPEAQRALVTLASQPAQPLATREAAVRAFTQAVRRRGVLLTRDEILLQYERYNRSEFLDADTQRVLGAILDAIEAPANAADAQAGQPVQAAAAS